MNSKYINLSKESKKSESNSTAKTAATQSKRNNSFSKSRNPVNLSLDQGYLEDRRRPS